MEKIDFIAAAIPLFFLAIGWESRAAKRRGMPVYRFNDSIADLSTGVVQQVFSLFYAVLFTAGGGWLWDRWRLFDLDPKSPWTWIAAIGGVDFGYYWFHRLSHQVHFLWAAHVVHHQSEEYNLTVALRQSALEPLFTWPFYWPVLIAGVHPLVLLMSVELVTLYQFWIHTRLIGKLPRMDRWLATPSNHRVHHGRNPRYIDRNMGGLTVIWDKLFGTYEPEGEPVVYGITLPLRSWNPVWANLHYGVHLWRSARASSWWALPVIGFMPLAWMPPGVPHPPPPPLDAPKYDPRAPRGVRRYVAVQFVLTAIALGLLILSRAPLWQKGIAGLFLVLAVVGSNAAMERKRWTLPLESFRLLGGVAVAAGMSLNQPFFAPIAAGLSVAAAVFIVWLIRLRSQWQPATG